MVGVWLAGYGCVCMEWVDWVDGCVGERGAAGGWVVDMDMEVGHGWWEDHGRRVVGHAWAM